MPTEHVKKWQHIAGLLGELHVVAWVTSTEWGEIASEIKNEYGSLVTPTNANFKQCYIGKNLLLRNSGTEDQGVVNAMNWIEIGPFADQFAWRRDNLITGKNSA